MTTRYNLQHARTITVERDRNGTERVTGRWSDGTSFEADEDECIWPGVNLTIKTDPGFDYLRLFVGDDEKDIPYVISSPVITWSVHGQTIKGGTTLVEGRSEWFELPLCNNSDACAIRYPDGLVQAEGFIGTVEQWIAQEGPPLKQARAKWLRQRILDHISQDWTEEPWERYRHKRKAAA